jgi:Protein of unknown function (DUF3309)
MRGADICFLPTAQVHVIANHPSEKRFVKPQVRRRMELYRFPLVFLPKAGRQRHCRAGGRYMTIGAIILIILIIALLGGFSGVGGGPFYGTGYYGGGGLGLVIVILLILLLLGRL